MKVLVATTDGQGMRAGDYSFTVDGELVTPVVVECASAARCGCGRGFPGFASCRATTTAMVVDLPGLDERDVRDAVRDSLERQGCGAGLAADELDDLLDALVAEHLDEIERVVERFPIGAVVGRAGAVVFDRTADARGTAA